MDIIYKIKDTYTYKYLAYRFHKFQVSKDPIKEINRYYNDIFGHPADLDNPKSIIEKIYWMQLYCDTSMWTRCADKYRMRDYVSEKGCSSYLPKLYGMWESPELINIDNLPEQFVLKANNGCATVLVVKNKKEHDWAKTKRQMKQWLSIPFGYSGYEPHYLRIKPCIIAEALLEQDEYLCKISPSSMVDYKFWCFNGHVESCFVAYNRKKNNLTVDLYDSDWNRLTDSLQDCGIDKVDSAVCIQKPACLEKMKEIASTLSKGFPEMRVDFYIVSGQPIIGELTLSSGYGYFTEQYYNHLGSLTDLSLAKRIK